MLETNSNRSVFCYHLEMMSRELHSSVRYSSGYGDKDLDFSSENEYSSDEFSDGCSCSSCCSICSECECEMCMEGGSESSSAKEQIHRVNGYGKQQLTRERRPSALKKMTPHLNRIGSKLRKVIHQHKKGKKKEKMNQTNQNINLQMWQAEKQVKKRVTFSDVSSSLDEDQNLNSSQSDTIATANASHYNGHILQEKDFEETLLRQDDSKRKLSISTNDKDIEAELFRLQGVLKVIDPQKLHSVLQHSLKKKRPEVVLALAALLPKKKFTADTIHCVRCHQEYHPVYGNNVCNLYHSELSVRKTSEDSFGANFLCQLCGTEFRLNNAWEYTTRINIEQDCGYCYQGIHTPVTEEVDYEPVGVAKSCEDQGCIVFYV